MVTTTACQLFLGNPAKEHWSAVKPLFRYLKGTCDLRICYEGDDGNVSSIAYSDADFANDVETRGSVTGYTMIMAGAPVIWSSHMQKCVAYPTERAEYVAALDGAQDLAEAFSERIGCEFRWASRIVIDNQSAILICKNTENHRRTGYIDIKYHFIR
ncbi:hypothetical protein JTB14_037070 [Gonioctena quinquepunctata]|nr:hypothetical protein JTB14_037070 [Gonioctena quinquepunctata]